MVLLIASRGCSRGRSVVPVMVLINALLVKLHKGKTRQYLSKFRPSDVNSFSHLLFL